MRKPGCCAVEDEQLINFHTMHIAVERELLHYGLHSGHVIAVHRNPAPTAVAADGVYFHYLFVQQAINKIAVAGNEGNKFLIKSIR